MNKTINFLQIASQWSVYFLIVFAFFHILIRTLSPDTVIDFYKLNTEQEVIEFSFRFWHSLRIILMLIPIVWLVLSGLCLLKNTSIPWVAWNKLWKVYLSFVSSLHDDCWWKETQINSIKNFIIYILLINMSRYIGAAVVDLIIIFLNNV